MLSLEKLYFNVNGYNIITAHADLDSDSLSIHYALSLLGIEELERADSFKFSLHRDRYIRSHAMLKSQLGLLLNIKPTEINYSYGSHGKPAIDNHSIEFNMSHSENIVAFAFSRDCDVGIDIEFIKPLISGQLIYDEVLNDDDLNVMSLEDNNLKLNTFYKIWTAKEAYLKSIGLGITTGIKGVHLNYENSQPVNAALESQPIKGLEYINIHENCVCCLAY